MLGWYWKSTLVRLTALGLLAGLTSVGRAHHNSLLALANDGKRLLTANADNGSVSVVDLVARKVIKEIPIGKRPESVAWIGTDKGIAADYLGDSLVVFDVQQGTVLKTIPVDNEPYGVIVDGAGRFAYVTHEYPGLVAEVDLETLAVTRRIPVGPYPRGIAFSNDEKQIFVVHWFSGVVTGLDRTSGTVVEEWKGSSADNLARQIAIHPTLPLAFVPHIRSRVERAHGAGSIFPYIAVLDIDAGKKAERKRFTIPLDMYTQTIVPCNPWECAVSPDGKLHFVVYAGTNNVQVSEVLGDGYRHLAPVGRPKAVGRNPRAIAISPDSKTAYVYNTLDYAVGVYEAQTMKLIESISVCANPYSESMHLGKVLFNTSLQPMSRQQWISCSSCHPDGDHDGRTWQNPEGLRRTMPFFGMARTYPIHWSADRDELQDFEHTIRGPLMEGRGLIKGDVHDSLGKPNAGRSKELDALAEYCNSFEHKRSPHALGPGKLTPAAERGKAIFFSSATRCAECHSGPDFTDRQVHDVGTGGDDPSEKMGPKYDTPTLLRVYRHLAYLHHGRARTLHEVLTTANKADKHGVTSHLKPNEIDDLVEFLKSLPYEN